MNNFMKLLHEELIITAFKSHEIPFLLLLVLFILYLFKINLCILIGIVTEEQNITSETYPIEVKTYPVQKSAPQ